MPSTLTTAPTVVCPMTAMGVRSTVLSSCGDVILRVSGVRALGGVDVRAGARVIEGCAGAAGAVNLGGARVLVGWMGTIAVAGTTRDG
jgi:hypothetical protein